MSRNYKYIINPSEITAGTRGSSCGPDAIFSAARNQQSTYFGDFEMTTITVANGFLDKPTTFDFAKRIDGYAKVFYGIKEEVSRTLADEAFPVVIAGDHGSAAGTIAGIKSSFPNKRLGVIWIDAHADIHSPYTTPSGNIHGMPLSISLNNNNLSYQHNNVIGETAEFWDAFQKSAGVTPMVLPTDLVYIAVRDCEKEEVGLMEELNITNHTVEKVRQLGVPAIAKAVEEQLENCDMIYISFDVDSMDPELSSYGTGTPVGNGLSPDEAKELLTILMKNEKVVCMELVEVNPCLDNKKNKMAEIAFDILSSVITK